jgi:site-specific DNA recombinase
MSNHLSKPENAVGAIRISSVKQGLQGDSPEDQKEQIERFAKLHNLNIKKFFIFMESASKEEQPVQEAIDYCKKKSNNIQVFVIKSIDRFTRGGSYLYDHLKIQLERNGVRLVDIYGIISGQQINTLEHLGIEYDWSIYCPTKKTEILEAERAKDEMRDIMTRMIGAEIRYVRMGYRVRRAPFGYENVKVETSHGKRVILKPHPEDSKWIIKMFESRLEGSLNDTEIVEKLNKLGFKTRTFLKRDPSNKTKVIGKGGGKQLTLKQFWRFVQNPVYAGINTEKWTENKPIRGKFDGLVSVKLFNKANRGKIVITIQNDKVTVYRDKPPDHLLNKQVKNPRFPYKRHVMCPHCSKPLYGSASRGKSGKYYPAYHCNKRGHYFRVSLNDFNEVIKDFVLGLEITPDYAEKLKQYALKLWKEKLKNIEKDNQQLGNKIATLKTTSQSTVEKIKLLSSDVAIKYMEEDLIKTENDIQELEEQRTQNPENLVDMDLVTDNIKYFLEHFEELLLDQSKPLKSAEYFSLVFEQPPTYEEIVSGTPQLAPIFALKGAFDSPNIPNGEPAGTRTQDTLLKRQVL